MSKKRWDSAQNVHSAIISTEVNSVKFQASVDLPRDTVITLAFSPCKSKSAT